MASPEYLKDLLITIVAIDRVLKGRDPEKLQEAQEAYRELLDHFYEEFQELMAPQQYEAAKKDPDYFIVLIQLVDYYQKSSSVLDGDSDKADPDWRLFTRC